MNIKKYFGTVLSIIGCIGIFVHPVVISLAFLGVLIFIQGSEDEVVKKTVKCIQKNKSVDELKNEKDALFKKEINNYSTK